jgi:hypothetical protein
MLREGSNIVPMLFRDIIPFRGLSTNGLKGQIYKSAIANKETIVISQSVG